MVSQGYITCIRKELKRSPIDEYDNENRILSSLRCLKHSNIIKLLASFTHANVHNLLFPLCDKDLAKFMRDERSAIFGDDYKIHRALFGLSSAIEMVHCFFSEEHQLKLIGCHYDLKPKNILVDGERFLLADFGLSRLRPESDGSNSTFKRGEGDYLAPECEAVDNGFEKHSIGRASDIWSFGCILVEVQTYVIWGPEGVRRFREARKHDVQNWRVSWFRSCNSLSPEVSHWIDSLEKEADRIGQQMLFLARRMLSDEAGRRPKIQQVRAELFFIAQKGMFGSCIKLGGDIASAGDFLEAMIQLERLKVWGAATGLDDANCLASGDSHWAMNASITFDHIDQILFELKQELESLLVQINDKGGLRPSFFQFRTSMDQLWHYIPPGLSQHAHNMLEQHLLNLESPFLSREIGPILPGLRYQDIGGLATVKYLTMLVEDYKSNGKSDLLLRKWPTFPEETKRFQPHSVGIFECEEGTKQAVLVEYMHYDIEWVGQETLFHRVSGLAELLNAAKPNGILTLSCLGFFHDLAHRSFGFIFTLPDSPTSLSATNLTSLEQLISDRDMNERRRRPDLGAIFRLAYALVRAIWKLHSVHWFHKNICSSNILLFPQDRSLQAKAESISRPYLTGFNHSREDGSNAYSVSSVRNKDYYHPEYRNSDKDGKRKRFCCEYDYYSLGLVLLELGLWRSLSELKAQKRGSRPDEFRKFLCDEMVPHLANSMGIFYRDAVLACLEGDFVVTQVYGDSKSAPLDKFLERVVDPLSKCHA
jgi:serine/threonine protein kinase